MLRKGAKWADRQGLQDFLFALPPINLGIQLLAEATRGWDAFSRAGSGVGGDDAIGRTRWWTVGVKRSVLVVHEPLSSRQRDSCIRKRNMQAAYIIDLSAI